MDQQPKEISYSFRPVDSPRFVLWYILILIALWGMLWLTFGAHNLPRLQEILIYSFGFFIPIASMFIRYRIRLIAEGFSFGTKKDGSAYSSTKAGLIKSWRIVKLSMWDRFRKKYWTSTLLGNRSGHYLEIETKGGGHYLFFIPKDQLGKVERLLPDIWQQEQQDALAQPA